MAVEAPLGRKQRGDNAHFLRVWEQIGQHVTEEQARRLVNRTAEEIRALIRQGLRLAFAWSGGKDSQALRAVMQTAGVSECMLAITELEYPEFLRWTTDVMPPGLEVINTGQDIRWLTAHPEMLFPETAAIAGRWFSQVQHRAQTQYMRQRGFDVLCIGRRRADGNVVPPDHWVTRADGQRRYLPIADWTHEQVLAVCHWYRMPLAPCYGWPRGFVVGTGPWPARQWCETPEQGWREVWTIDRGVVEGAALWLPGARAFLEGV